MPASTTILIGTTKGAFLLSSPNGRQGWALNGPLCDGWPINHIIGDPETGTIWAAGGGDWQGAGVWSSRDNGNNWTLAKFARGELDAWAAEDPELARNFGWEPVDAPFDGDLTSLWSLHYAHGTLYAGAKPAALFASRDGGTSWARIDGLSNHPSRDSWNPGGAGLVLHTIVSTPESADKLWLGISAAGVFATEDGGISWERRNRLSNADACAHHFHPAAPRDGETGHCVHNMVRAGTGDLLYQQNHHGTWRSPDGGRSWEDITEGLPSTFGFPIAVHPHDPQTLWVLPLNSDSDGRYPPEASAKVWKSTDGGASWTARQNGLPAQNCFFTVLRQAMATDMATPAGIYFGTNTGSVFASTDEGDNWAEIARHLPTILSIEVLEDKT
ncbi:exo-alpha-sialidase [uncultured Roseovarius sp.]|uniref:WD40/YVTN/BNR-like repeat-containing protein n=1 Tax=uncultured Roseovarius sp. TaxID=293344 RepID=UPI00260E94ED|nr:exo-alpha-sialidase [uncultured Roseovarius sp.]